MKLNKGFNPSCSECAFVLYPDKMDEKQKEFIGKFIKKFNLEHKKTPKGNITIEYDDKTMVVKIKELFEMISEWESIEFKEFEQYYAMRDESYYDLLEEGNL